ncbi:MAG: hypothetical protein AAF296_04540 [Pseudomonadota bacterium]
MSGAVILARYSSIEEALVVYSLLRANSIEASLENWHHAQNDWFLVHALEGVAIRVPWHEIEDSKRILSDKFDASPIADDASTEPRNRRIIRRWSLPVVFLGFVNLPILIGFWAAIELFPITMEGDPRVYHEARVAQNAQDRELRQRLAQQAEPEAFIVRDIDSLPPAPPPPSPEIYHIGRASTYPNLEGLAIYLAIIGLLVAYENRRRDRNEESDRPADIKK